MDTFKEPGNVEDLADAVKAGDMSRARALLHAHPELIDMDMAENNEHRALHFAVLRRDAAMTRLLMEAGADARKGIYPHRDATSAWSIAHERGYREIAGIIEQEEKRRREELSCPNATVSPVQERIQMAISEHDNEQAIRLLESDPSLVHACDREGQTPLHAAASDGNAEMVQWLLQKRAKVNKRDSHDQTPLDAAALGVDPRYENAQAFLPIARLLLEHGAELTATGAVALGDNDRVRELLTAAPNLLRKIGHDGGLLTLAVNHGRLETVRLLLDLGADVDERITLEQVQEPVVSWGMPLWYAALGNQYEAAKLLLDRGADPNANVYASGWPLRNAWNHPGGEIKKLLLERGAKPQPYMVSEAHDVAEAERLLAEDGSESLAQELAWSAADSGCAAIVEVALACLQWPANDRRWHWILIQPVRGATSDHADRAGHFASMAVLLRRGIDLGIARYGQTVLHFTAGYHGDVSGEDRARFAEMLIDGGASLTARDDLLKSTPLGWASRWGRTRMAKVLISRGASLTEPDAEPWATPKAWAEKMKQTAILALLQ